MHEAAQWSSTPDSGVNGGFCVPYSADIYLICVAADRMDWEQVAVFLVDGELNDVQRCPTWEEMCFVKELFWDEEDTVLQFHPKRSEYVNYHPYMLHLWKVAFLDHALPPREYLTDDSDIDALTVY